MRRYNVMLKPASSLCNLRCRYCFYCDVADLRAVRSFGIMTDETMRDVLRSLERSLSPGDQITVLFQGGEPMLAGLDFFRRFASRTDAWDPGISVSFATARVSMHRTAARTGACWKVSGCCKKTAWISTCSARSQIPSRATRKRSGSAWSSWMCALCSSRRAWTRWKHRAKAGMP